MFAIQKDMVRRFSGLIITFYYFIDMQNVRDALQVTTSRNVSYKNFHVLTEGWT